MLSRYVTLVAVSLFDLLGAHPTLAARSPSQCFELKSPLGLFPKFMEGVGMRKSAAQYNLITVAKATYCRRSPTVTITQLPLQYGRCSTNVSSAWHVPCGLIH